MRPASFNRCRSEAGRHGNEASAGQDLASEFEGILEGARQDARCVSFIRLHGGADTSG
jgi:hypothetical protein